MKAKKVLSPKLISYLFHPIVIPTMALTYFYFSNLIDGFNPNLQSNGTIGVASVFGTTLLCTFFIPLLSSIYLLKKGEIISLHMENKEERIIPFCISGTSIFAGYYFLFEFIEISSMPVVQWFYLGSLFAVILGLGVTLVWKISVHMIGIGGFTGAIIVVNHMVDEVLLIPIIFIIFISGLVAYSRQYMKAHDNLQLLAGYLLGIVCQTFILLFV